MSQPLHHTRLLLGLEIRGPETISQRMLPRARAEALGHAVAADLARVVPDATASLLSLAATLLDLTDLLRPGLPAHRALEQMAEAAMNQQGFEPRILSIGAGGGRMPDAALMPRSQRPQGQFLLMPLLLSAPPQVGQKLETLCEQKLFEHGGLGPPALEILGQETGLEAVHGQLLTLFDLLAMQRVQLEGAGLDAPARLLEAVVTGPENPAEETTAEGLHMRWDPEEAAVELEFIEPSAWAARHGQGLRHYEFWLKAARQVPALLAAHGLASRWQHPEARKRSHGQAHWLEIEDPEPARGPGLTRHAYPELGAVAFTLSDGRRQTHYHPLDRAGLEYLDERLSPPAGSTTRTANPPAHDPDSGKLTLKE